MSTFESDIQDAEYPMIHLFKVDKFGIVHTTVGKISFTAEQIVDNAKEVLNMILKLKPAAAKGSYVKSIYLSTR